MDNYHIIQPPVNSVVCKKSKYMMNSWLVKGILSHFMNRVMDIKLLYKMAVLQLVLVYLDRFYESTHHRLLVFHGSRDRV